MVTADAYNWDVRGIVLGLLIGLAQAAVPDASLYQRRRATLAEAHPDCAGVLFAQSDSDVHHLRSSFFQEPNFFYLTGWREPGAILLITRDRQALFLPERDLAQERWTGPRTSADMEGVEQLTGFRHVASVTQFETQLRAALERAPRLCTLRDTPQWDRLAQMQPLREIRDLRPSLARMRMTKSAEEIRHQGAAPVVGGFGPGFRAGHHRGERVMGDVDEQAIFRGRTAGIGDTQSQCVDAGGEFEFQHGGVSEHDAVLRPFEGEPVAVRIA